MKRLRNESGWSYTGRSPLTSGTGWRSAGTVDKSSNKREEQRGAAIRTIRFNAERSLSNRGRYSIDVMIGMCKYTFTVRQHGSCGYSLTKGEDIIDEYPTADRALTVLYDAIQMYI